MRMPRPDQPLSLMDLGDGMAKHALGDLKVGYNAVLHRPDRDDRSGRAPQHILGFGPHCQNLSGVLVNGDNRWLTQDEAFFADVDQGVGRPEIDGQIV